MTRFLSEGRTALRNGPVAIIVVEDDVAVDATLRHHLFAGFPTVLALMPDAVPLAPDVAARVIRVRFATGMPDAAVAAVNGLVDAAAGSWVFYGHNAEFLFFPFCRSRRVGELLAFHESERRDAMLTYVIDLYAGDLLRAPDGVSLDDAHLDRTGYYALARSGPDGPRERQLDFYGGLRWRFEEHVPPDRRRIDRIGLFRARKGLRLRPGHTFSDEEYNTYACPWHHNLTAAICSFRAAKALRSNPESRAAITGFRWHNSVPFAWSDRQLMDLGLMEPGQWF